MKMLAAIKDGTRTRLANHVVVAMLLLMVCPPCAADNVLILNSYHRGKTLSDDTINAIIKRLQPKHRDLTFLIEDMDTKRHDPAELRAGLLSHYRQKYQDVELRAVVTIDNNAFDFAVAHREELFPDVPLVFCGYNGFQPSILDGIDGVTGVAEAVEFESTIRVALALHPQTTHLAVVSDTTPTGRELSEEFRQFAKRLPQSLQIVELANLTALDLKTKLSSLPRSSVVLRFCFFRDANGQSFRIDEQVDLIMAAGLPVYDFWDEAIGDGYVGGYVVTGESQGQMVATMLERILAGESPENIEVVDRSPNIPVFDKRQLLRTGADLSRLPPNSVLLFDEAPFWQRHQRLLIGFGIAFLVLFGLAVFFAVLSVQRKRHADALSHEEQKLRATLQSIGEGVVTTNPQGEVENLNSIAQRWAGVPPEEAHGRPMDEVFQIAVGSTDAGRRSFSSSAELPPTTSGVLRTSSGDDLPIVLTAAPISLPQGSKSGTVIVFRDMTRENQLQQEMEQVRRLDALGQLAGGVAHDFNNMLGGIVGAAEVLRDELADHKMNEFPKLILDSAHGAAELTVQLLSFARKQPVSRKHQHFHPIVNETIAVLKRTIDPRIEIEYRPEAKADVIHGDETLLKSCLLNLGINASHAMPSGGTLTFTTNEVRLTAEDCAESSFDLNQGRHIEVRVEDSGVGIDPDVMKRIFEPFFTTKRNGKGTGLGLAAVFGTVQQHDGSVAVQSTPGCGTTFTIRLPLSAQPANQPKNLDKAVNGEGVILVVDDQPLLRRMATKNLNVLGYEVLTASNGLEALEIYQREQRRIDVVLLDMIMPKMNGRDCFVELKRLDPQVRVIATSGFYSQDDFQEITRLGLSHHLTKPYRRAELSRVVHQAIQATA